ncbi:hypothetical protein [Shewanella gaetbuli]
MFNYSYFAISGVTLLLTSLVFSTVFATDDWSSLTRSQANKKASNSSGQDNHQRQSSQLGHDEVLDDQGNPIAIRTPAIALEYQANEAAVVIKPQRKPYKAKSLKSTKNISKNKLADDPSCRWLHQRTRHLLSQLRDNQRHQTHVEEELSARMSEWKCLKCDTDGPSQGDHDRCQYKR